MLPVLTVNTGRPCALKLSESVGASSRLASKLTPWPPLVCPLVKTVEELKRMMSVADSTSSSWPFTRSNVPLL